MRKLILAFTLATFGAMSVLAAPVSAQPAPPATLPVPAVEAAPATSLSSSVPAPTDPDAIDYYRVAAIAAGAVGGILVANVVVASLAGSAAATAGGAAAVSTAGYAASAGQIAVSTVGAVVGGYVGGWIYGSN